MNIEFINVSEKPIQLRQAKTDDEFVSYTIDGIENTKQRINQLAYELIELYNNSSKHNAIVTSKINYITGNGFEKVEDAQSKELLRSPNPFDTGELLLEKITTDLELQGGYYLQLVFSKIGGKLLEVYHVPFEKMQPNENASKFKFIDDPKKPREYTIYDAYDGKRQGTKVLYVSTYRAGSGVLCLPEYYASLRYIQIDKEIANFNYNNIKSGFSAGTMIVLYNGEPTDEEEAAIKAQLKNNTTGSDKAGNTWVYFAKQGDEAPQVIPLNGNDLVDKFAQLNEQCRDEIFIGHKVVSGILFGVKTEGQLGGRNEMLEAYELFSNGYVEPKQKLIESTFNLVNRLYGGTSVIRIKKSKPIGIDYLGLFREGIITDRRIVQKELGIKIDQPKTQLNEQGIQRENDWVQFEEFGESAEEWEEVKEIPIFFNEDHIPVSFDAVEDDILKTIVANPFIDTATLANILGYDAAVTAEKLGELIEKKLVDPDRGLQVTEQGKLSIEKSPKSEFFVKYKYDGVRDSRNRAFCARLLQLNRLYTREDINTLSQRLGYNVWMRRGGWYHNPTTDVNTPYCRHTWKQVIVKRKL